MCDMMAIVFWLLVLVVFVPVVVYLSVKLGTFAFYRGRQVFLDQQKEKTRNGDVKNKA